jgi:dephospho-CoA kinase
MKKLKKKFITLNKKSRLYYLDKPIIALTGGIATGKSTVTKLLALRGIEIIDADQLVKSIYEEEETKIFIQENFKQAWVEMKINFKILREIFFKDSNAKNKIEAFIYARLPEVFKQACEKIKEQDFYVYDVPLLFERDLDKKVDLVVVAYSSRQIQLKRLMERDKIDEKLATSILDQQMNIELKKNRANFILNNSGNLKQLADEVHHFILQVIDD